MLSDEEKDARRARGERAVENAKKVLEKGDRLRVTKCPGTKRWIVFECWDGIWIVSKSGMDDYHPVNVDRLNGEPVDFSSMSFSVNS